MPTRSSTQRSRATASSSRKKKSARAARTRPRSNGASDALSLLHADHEAVGAMIDEIEECEAGDERLRDLAKSMATALTAHAKIEEDLFYPELRDRAEGEEQLTDVFEAYTEHDVIKHLLALVKSDRGPDEKFKAELQVLGESVKHHVKEEESTIFKLARTSMSRDELQECGAAMSEEKSRLQKSARP